MLIEVRKQGRIPKFLTLTQRSRPGEPLDDTLNRLQRAFGLLRRRTLWRRHVRAFVASREMTVGRDGHWHAHLHLVIDADYWPQSEIADEWERVTRGESRIVDIREARAGVERELLKYAFKIAGVTPERLVEYALAVKGTRGISTGGCWFDRVADEDLGGEAGGQADAELLTFQMLLRRARGADPWALAVKDAIDRWILQRTRSLPEEVLRRLLPSASVH